MESTTNVSEERQTPTPIPSADLAGDDLISGLNDDVLLHILRLVADARDVVCTSVLSRRWRDLWTRAPVLLFDPWPAFESAGDVERYVEFVSNVLAKRAQSEEGVELLVFPLVMDLDCLGGQRDQLLAPSAKAAEAWIRYGAQHAVTCFLLKLRLPGKKRHLLSLMKGLDEELEKRLAEFVNNVNDDDDDDDGDDEEDHEEGVNEEEGVRDGDDDDEEEFDHISEEDQERAVIDLDELPSSANLETMALDLNSVRVRLPSTAVFPSLTVLKLDFIKLENGSGHLLSRLLSSACCPRLQKLSMVYIYFKHSGTKQLSIDVDTLSELSLENMNGLEALELRTPNLLDLQIEDSQNLKSLNVMAPGLEELTYLHNSSQADIHGELPCVWALKIDLISHMLYDCDINYTGICLLQRCSSARSLLVKLFTPSLIERRVDMIKDKIPQFPHITSLAVHMHPMTERHSFGDGVAGLLSLFSNLRYLVLQLDEVPGCKNADEFWSKEDSTSFACDHEDHWESSSMSFIHLRKAEFKELTGTDCELRFLQSVLASTTDIRKVTISLSENYSVEEGRMDQYQQKLLSHGTWTAYHDDDYGKSYKWSPSPKVENEFA